MNEDMSQQLSHQDIQTVLACQRYILNRSSFLMKFNIPCNIKQFCQWQYGWLHHQKRYQIQCDQNNSSSLYSHQFRTNLDFYFQKFPYRKILYLEDEVSQAEEIFLQNQSKGRSKYYKCVYCPNKKPHHSQKVVKKHKLICKNRKQFKLRNYRQHDIHQFVQKIKQKFQKNRLQEQKKDLSQINYQKASKKQKQSTLQNQIQQLKREVKQIKNNFCQRVPMNFLDQSQRRIKKMKIVSQIINNIGDTLLNCIRTNVGAIIEGAINSGLKIEEIKQTLSLNLLNKVQAINYHQILFSFNHKLKEAYELLQLQSAQKDVRTKRDNTKAWNFFSKFQQFHLINQTLVIYELCRQTDNKQKNYRRFFSKIRLISPYFSRFPMLPKILKKKSWRKIRPIIKLSQVINNVSKLIAQNRYQLATDVWSCICMGLRSPELLKMEFKSSNGLIIHSLKIIQNKNFKTIIRYIPTSLAILISSYNIIYPMPFSRLKAARQFCLQAFSSFYGIRALLITSIVSTLSKFFEYGSFHRSINTTKQFYLTGQQSLLLDNTFELPFTQNNQLKEKLGTRKTVLNLTGIGPKQMQNQKYSITLESASQINLQQINQLDSIMTRSVEIQDVKTQEIQQEQKDLILSQQIIFNNLNRELSSNSHKRFQDAVQECFEDQNMFQVCFTAEKESLGQISTQQSVFKVLNTISDIKIILHQNDSEGNLKSTNLTPVENNQNQEIHISKSKSSRIYRSIESDKATISRAYLDRKSKQISKLKSTAYFKKIMLQVKRIKCKMCSIGYFLSSIVQIEGKQQNTLQCSHCKQLVTRIQNPKYPSQHLKQPQDIKIDFINDSQLDLNCTSISPKKQKNNLISKIKQQYGPQAYSFKSYYSRDFPNQFKTYFCKVSEHLKKQILFNRHHEQYLPLKIMKSKNKGWGIFAQQRIQRNKILLSYTGVISTTFTTDLACKSLFKVGFLSGIYKSQVFIFPCERLNSCRYINSSDQDSPPNCQVKIAMLDEQIVLIIISKKTIEKGGQVLYDYGSNYFQKVCEKQKVNQSQDQQS